MREGEDEGEKQKEEKMKAKKRRRPGEVTLSQETYLLTPKLDLSLKLIPIFLFLLITNILKNSIKSLR